LMTSDLICPSPYQPLRSSFGDSGLDVSLDMSASLEYLFGLARASLAEYKIPYDLHPWLPLEEFLMSELSNNAIGVYHRIFDLYGVHIPFSSFVLDLIKHYKKSGFFLIDQRAIPDYMYWRYPNSALNGLKLPVGSFNMEDVRRLSMHVVKLRDMPEGVLVLSGLSRVWKSQTCDLELRVTNGNVMEDLVAGNSSAKVVAKDEASQKQKASSSGATLSHVAKRTRSALAQLFGSTTRPNLFAKNSDDESDDDAYVSLEKTKKNVIGLRMSTSYQSIFVL
nr:hypothetical protein [Tanacetum cinerariifolium]